MKWFYRFLFFLILLLALYAVVSHGGVYDLWQMKKNIKKAGAKNMLLIRQRDSLAQQINLLQSNNFYIEKIARDELGMVRKGDIVVYFRKDTGRISGPVAAPQQRE